MKVSLSQVKMTEPLEYICYPFLSQTQNVYLPKGGNLANENLDYLSIHSLTVSEKKRNPRFLRRSVLL